jgi:hypothetical protein
MSSLWNRRRLHRHRAPERPGHAMPARVNANGSFIEVLTAAINDMVENGFDSAERLAKWMHMLRAAAERQMKPPGVIEDMLRSALRAIFTKQVEQGKVLERHPGVEAFTLENIKPQLREELDRRIRASADLIKLNRAEAIERTMKRFAGWASSIPAGGANVPERAVAKEAIKRGIAGLPFIERRVIIDQGHKLTSAINDTLADEAGAIAGIWHSHWRQPGYDYREDHKERDENVYLIRDSWAHSDGLVKPSNAGYTDDITMPGEEPFCRCFYQYLYNLRDLPSEMLTAKGKKKLEEVRAYIAKL